MRSQIARGWGKRCLALLPSGDLLAFQYQNLEFERNPRYPAPVSEAALCRSTDNRLS